MELINSWNWLIDPLMQELLMCAASLEFYYLLKPLKITQNHLGCQKYHGEVVLFAGLDFCVNSY